MWSRRLEIAELLSLWVSGCAKHGLPPPPEWVDWRAAPAAGIVRVIGTAADALTGAVLEYVRVCAVKRGEGHPLSGAHGESGVDGAFGIEVPADEAVEEEEGVLVLTLTLAGYAPQTLSVAMRGGQTAWYPAHGCSGSVRAPPWQRRRAAQWWTRPLAQPSRSRGRPS